MARAPGLVRDAIVAALRARGDATVEEIQAAVAADIGPGAPSSVRSYLRLNTPGRFTRVSKGRYKLTVRSK